MSDQPLITDVATYMSVLSGLSFLIGVPFIVAIVYAQPDYLWHALAVWLGLAALFLLSAVVVTFTATGVEGRFLRGTMPEQQGYTGGEMPRMNDDGTYGEKP